MYKKYIKRLMDIMCSLAAIIILSPVMLVLFLLIRIKLGSPVLFRQKRIGKDEKIFTMYKFRTMTDRKDENGNLLSDDERLTTFGTFLRSTSLDELPEIFNILMGDLSIVGPRSLLVEYLPYYTDYEKLRHSVRGGLTPPEVLYNNIRPTWEEQFQYEVDYSNHVTFIMDMKIIFSTIKGVFKRKSEDYGSYIRKTLIEEREVIADLQHASESEPEAVTAKK